MAIIIEEEKGGSGLGSWLGWLVILIILGGGAYYLFVFSPPPAVITPPAALSGITAASQVNFDPQTILQSPVFHSLDRYIPAPSSTGPGAVGKANPFTP